MHALGIHAHPTYKLGKKPAIVDPRTLKFSSVLSLSAPTPPSEYDWDQAHNQNVPMPMFGNDRHGDCVIAGRGHQTLRFELVEQQKLISISDADILNEYFKETGGPDSGLVVVRSLAAWRSKGWQVGNDNYKIKAFASVNTHDMNEIKSAIYADLGVGIGISVPHSAFDQFSSGQPWEVVPGSKIVGGHYVYCVGYDSLGPICITWGRRQRMSWNFWQTYCDEAYAIWDDSNANPQSPKWGMILWQIIEDFLQWLATK